MQRLPREYPAEFISQPSFAAGEVGPELWGRIDQEFHYIAMRTVRNWIIRQYGGASNRMGLRYVAEARYNDKDFRLVKFAFNEEQTYTIELGDEYMRIIADGGQVVEANKTITGITQADPGVITSVAHGLTDGEDVYVSGVVGMIELNGRTFRVANKTTDTFELTDYLGNDIDTTGYAAYASGGTLNRIYTVETPWAAEDIFRLNFTQSNDVLTVVHPDYYPRDITRTGNAAWTVSLFDNNSGPFADENTTSTTVTVDDVTGAITITASADIFNSDMVGDLLYIEQEPSDSTPTWEASKLVPADTVYRAGTHYYLSTYTSVSRAISAISSAANSIITTSLNHGFTTGDIVFIQDVAGMTEINGLYFKVKVIDATRFYPMNIDNDTLYTNTTSFGAYSSGGTSDTAKKTGTIKPDWTEGSQTDGADGVEWEYLHSGFGIVELTAYTSATEMDGTVVNRIPDNVVSNPTTIWAKSAWSEEEGYPSAAVYHKGRLIFAATASQPSLLWMSKAKVRTDFSESNPILDDEAITLSMNATELNAIRHLLPLQDLIVLTSAAEFLIKGDGDGALLASVPPNPIIQGYTGSSHVPPIVIGNTAVMVQDLGSSVHSLKYQFDSDSFGGIDLTARSPHLFRNKYIVDWAYQRHPFSTIWAIMSDGGLNGFTFMEEQRVYAWHRHDSDDANFLTVATIREGRETSAYFGVEREINGATRKYIEVFASRYFDTIEDAFFVDSGVTYDGRNTGVETITITGGTTWASEDAEDLTLTCTSPIFTQLDADVRNQIVFNTTHEDGTAIRMAFEITGYTNTTVVTAIAIRDVPVAYRGVARTDWNFAKKQFYGLDHIEGKNLACLSEGNVVPDLVVTNGAVTLPEPGYVNHLGIGYVCDFETLDITAPQGSTKAKMLSVAAAHITVQETKSLNVGNNGFDKVKRAPVRGIGTGYDAASPASTGLVDVILNTSYSRQGRLCIREDQPIPVTVNCITLELESGDNG